MRLVLLAAVLIASMVIYRPFCKYLCPLGGIYGLLQKIGFLQLHHEEASCISCGIVGVLFDAWQGTGLADGAAIEREFEVTYPNVKVWKTWADEIPVSGVPTSFFVDREGRLAGEPIVGADLAAYEDTLNALLGEEKDSGS